MRTEQLFNPLDKKSLGTSIANALLAQPVGPLPPCEKFIGAGIYAIYFSGDHAVYRTIAKADAEGKEIPLIYVGKAVPEGAHKGGFGLDTPAGVVLFSRLCDHAESIQQTKNLSVKDFACRYLVVDEIWIPLGESLLIEMFSPIWNRLIDGFGNHDPGSGSYRQQRSPWDVLHPGRTFAEKLQPHSKTDIELLKAVAAFVAKQKRR